MVKNRKHLKGEGLGSYIVRVDAVDVRHRIGKRDQVTPVGAHNALCVARRAGRLEQVERVVSVNWNGVVRFRVHYLRLVVELGQYIVRPRS